MQLTKNQERIMDSDGHLLVTGGPGAAKIAELELRPGQKVLFLSFARATVSRVVEAIEHEQKIPKEQRSRIEVETYHSFFWRILKAHGYLVGLPRKLSILTPPNEAISLSAIRKEYPSRKLSDAQKAEKKQRESIELIRLAVEDGKICFDLFSQYIGEILHGSERVRKLIGTMFPFIILDEFQDTNAAQWRVVQALGQTSTLFALADPEQRIYEWIGADPQRLEHLKQDFNPTAFDLSTDNHRSPGTDIALFGNDILSGNFREEPYSGVYLSRYPGNEQQAWSALITAVYTVRARLIKLGVANWSIAVLVPTKRMTRLVSDAFRSPPGNLTAIYHSAVIDMDATILAAEIVAFLMQPDIEGIHFEKFIHLVCNYFHGRGGESPTKADLDQAENIQKAYSDYISRKNQGKDIRAKSILIPILEGYQSVRRNNLTGDPDSDWNAVRQTLEMSNCSRLKLAAEDVRNIRILDRGTQLRQALSLDWRENGCYENSLSIVQRAFVKEHFSASTKPESGVVVMNMHKAKGKQFDEVIIFEGWPRRVRGKIVANPDRIVWDNLPANCNGQARQNLRVSVTRGKLGTTILSPAEDLCVIFR
jgi:DNA helicase II / ATP-dependent DNA helicase PcrA